MEHQVMANSMKPQKRMIILYVIDSGLDSFTRNQ